MSETLRCVEWVLARLRDRLSTLVTIHPDSNVEAAVGAALLLRDPRSRVLCGIPSVPSPASREMGERAAGTTHSSSAASLLGSPGGSSVSAHRRMYI